MKQLLAVVILLVLATGMVCAGSIFDGTDVSTVWLHSFKSGVDGTALDAQLPIAKTDVNFGVPLVVSGNLDGLLYTIGDDSGVRLGASVAIKPQSVNDGQIQIAAGLTYLDDKYGVAGMLSILTVTSRTSALRFDMAGSKIKDCRSSMTYTVNF